MINGGRGPQELPTGWIQRADGTIVSEDGRLVGVMQPDGQVLGYSSDQLGFNGRPLPGMQPHTYDPTGQAGVGTYWNMGQQRTDTGNELDVYRSLLDPASTNSAAYSYRGDPAKAAEDIRHARAWENYVQTREAPQADLRAANADRALQEQAAGGYASMLAGGGPSVADQMMSRGVGAAGSQALLAGAVAPRGSLAAAQRNALVMGGAAAKNAALQGVGLRLGEQQTATAGLMGTAGAMRGADISSALRNAQLVSRQRDVNDAASARWGNQALGINEAQMGGQLGRQHARQDMMDIFYKQSNKEEKDRRAQRDLDVDTAMGAVGDGMTGFGTLSDERAKERISDGSKAAREMLDKLHPHEYWYKSGLGTPGKKLGIMAQDLEASELGKSAVRTEEDGYKRVDIPMGLGLAMAGLAETHRRLKKLEGRKK